MQEFNLLEIYKKQIEVVLGMLGIFKGDKAINEITDINAEDKEFIKNYMQNIYADNLNTAILNKAIDELLPYLYMVN